MLRPNRNRPANDNRFDFIVPNEVVFSDALTSEEKREILSRWASDSCAVVSLPTLRQLPGTPFPVTFASIMDARAQLDRMEEETLPGGILARFKMGPDHSAGA